MDRLDSIKLPVERELGELRDMFDGSLESSIPLLKQVLGHVIQRKGKMMRPLLTLLVAKEFGEVSADTYHAGAALEMLHTASLIHDDVVDESDERRGQPSVNVLYGNRVAVLTGDYLYAAVLSHSIQSRRMEVVDVIAHLGRELVNGEMLQLSNADVPELSEEAYFEVIRRKTASLFAACAQLGALTANAPGEEVERFRLFGEMVGICFQIRDDIFDYYEGGSIGKPTGNDMQEGKLTLPVLYALSRVKDEEMLALASKVKEQRATCDEIARLVDFTKANGGIDYAYRVMSGYRDRALHLLEGVADPALKASLAAYVNYVIDREK